MSSLAVTATSYSSAPSVLVCAALLDAESWPSWTSYYEVQWELPVGVERPARVDDLRTIRSRLGRVCCRERIVELVPDQRFNYEQTAGLFASHRRAVDLARAPHGGTNITWSATYRHTLPFLGTLRRRRLQILVHDLASYASSIVSRNCY
ncbi:SRPBCC family protein [Streptomyces sp. YIM B13518]|uniref:SRPBCC family protein n=1 Tax=Streptomyces sp. YIM B13518 TaxID=3366316 RepID=UPI0036C4D652